MEIYKENQKRKEKHWVIRLEVLKPEKAALTAVDKYSGKFITYLIVFHEDGGVRKEPEAQHILLQDGYDSFEHKNSWDENGMIEIEN